MIWTKIWRGSRAGLTIVHRASEANGTPPPPVADIKVKVCFYCASSSAFQKRRRFAAIVIIIVELLAEICHVERVRSKLLVQYIQPAKAMRSVQQNVLKLADNRHATGLVPRRSPTHVYKYIKP